MAIPLNMGRDVTGSSPYAPLFTNDNKQMLLEADVEQTTLVPSVSFSYYVIFSIEPGAKVWIAQGSTAITPPSGAIDDTNAQLNPGVRTVYAGETLRFITSDDTAEVGVSYYAVA